MIIRLNDIKYKPKKLKRIEKTKQLSSHYMNVKNKHMTPEKITYWQEMRKLHETLGDNRGQFDGIMNAWKDEPCFVIGTSRAIEGFDFNLLNGLHTIGINHLIEDWDLMEWFIFLDERFLAKTTYDINKFKGKIFASSRTNILKKKNYIRYRQLFKVNEIELNIINGLYGKLTGLNALHLALISGAKPIYLLGMDTLKEDEQKKDNVEHHYKKDYIGEKKTHSYLMKYVRTEKGFLKFTKWKDRIINVCIDGTMPNIFRRISQDELKKDIDKIKNKEVVNQTPIICHVTNLKYPNEIYRQIVNLTEGKHIQAYLHSSVYPKADIYILECIMRDAEKFRNWKNPCGKLISIVHSGNVYSKYSDKIVTLTESQKINNSVAIPCGIDMNYYKYDIDYDNKIFGRITPYSVGKVHPKFNDIVSKVKEKFQDSKCIMICNNAKNKSKNIEYIEDIKRHENEKKAKILSGISIFVDMHHTYKETFSISLLEAMASGLAIILYSTIDQQAMWEVLGDAGIICKSVKEFEEKLIWLLENPEEKKKFGLRAKERAKLYSIENMVNKWNKLFKELL